MATGVVQPAEHFDDRAPSAGRTFAPGLIWATFMLFILGLWLGIKHEELSRPVIWLVWVMAAVAFACALWQMVAAAKQGVSLEEKSATLSRQRKVVGLLLVLGGLILLALAVYLGVLFRLAAIGEVIGMFLLGITSWVSARRLLKAETAQAGHPLLDLLRRRHGRFGMIALVVGVFLVIETLAFIFLVKPRQEDFFLLAGELFFGFLAAGAGMWLSAQTSDGLTAARMRVFVLVVGGALGLILSLCALAQAIVWRSEVFGGMSAWQGDRSWQLWLCAYVELFGLGLMFASVLLARTDIRSSAALRRVLYGYNAFLTGLLLLAMLVVMNIVLYALLPGSLEWSKSRGAHTLSTSTKNLLHNLREPTTIYVLMPRFALDSEVKNFLENCENQSDKLKIKYLSPDKDFEEYENLAKRFPESLSGRVARSGAVDRGILIVYGSAPADKKPPHAFIPMSRLSEVQPPTTREGKGVKVFKGESEVMTELSFLAQDRKKRKVYFLQGEGELDINNTKAEVRRDLRSGLDELGCAVLVEGLKKEQMEVQGLSFGEEVPKDKAANLVIAKESGPDKRKEVPEDAEAVIIAGASAAFAPKTLDALERYMDRGGKLLVFLDITLDSKSTEMRITGIEGFLRKYGVQVGNQFALRVVGQARDDPRTVIATAPREATNELAKAFQGEIFPMRTVRVVRPEPSASKYTVDVLWHLDRREPQLRQLYMEETAVRALTNPLEYQSELDNQRTLVTRLSADPLPVAVAVSEKLALPGGGKEGTKPRLIVMGDAECLSNFDITRSQIQISFAWLASALEWMAEKKTGLVGPRTKEATSYSLDPFKVNVPRLEYLPGWLMILSIVSLGAGIWVVRRK